MSHLNTHYVFHHNCSICKYCKYSVFYLDNKEEEEILARTFVQKFHILSFLLILGPPILFFQFFVAYYYAFYISALSLCLYNHFLIQ
jgi:hypothetical protein